MIPSLVGRLQTRVTMMATIGVLWTLVFAGLRGIDVGRIVFVLVVATVFGLGWEVAYDAWARRRWDQDFPSGLFLIAGLWEFVPVAAVAVAIDMPIGRVAEHFFVLWVAVWLFLQGPMRVVVPRWRFRAGRVW